jgi:hypothetical protein
MSTVQNVKVGPEEAEAMAESIESLLTVEMRPMGHPAFGRLKKIWRAAVDLQKGYPTMLAAQRIVGSVKSNDVVIITTGLVIDDFLPNGENDGPLGAASIAYALRFGLGAIPVILCEEPVVSACKSAVNAIGLRVRTPEVARRIPWAAVVEGFPTEQNRAESKAMEIIDAYQPKAMFAIERISVNKKGIQHTATGKALTGPQAKMQFLWGKARERGILTIGIGDNGNEVGLGILVDAIHKYNKYGATCVCGCEGGIAATEEADVAVVTSVSNWGAYGIAACLGITLRNPNLIHTGETEERMIEECVRAGALDGRTGLHVLAVDGIPAKIHSHIVDVLGAIVRTGLSQYVDRRY